MKRALTTVVALFMLAGVALADHGGGPPRGDGGFGGFGPGDDLRGGGEGIIVGSDGTAYVTRAAATSTAANRVNEIVAIRPTGVIAWTATLPSGAGHAELSGANLIAVTHAAATSTAAASSTLTAIATATGAAAWTLTLDGFAGPLEPFSGGTYVTVVKPATTAGGTATRSLVAVSSAGSVLWTVAI